MSVSTIQPGAYITQHCANGGHENAKVLSPGGTLMPACRGEYTYRFVSVTCWCWCHEMFRTMRQQQADASSDASDTMPDIDTPATAALGPIVPVTTGATTATTEAKSTFYESVLANDAVSVQVKRFVNKHVFDADDKNVWNTEKSEDAKRRTRGSLDINVEAVCRLWLDGKLPYQELTPVSIGMVIDISNPPSSGAIYAVLQRWKENALAELAEKPFRFIAFSPSVGECGIDAIKGAHAREKRAKLQGFF
jgi:hypothetical protein